MTDEPGIINADPLRQLQRYRDEKVLQPSLISMAKRWNKHMVNLIPYDISSEIRRDSDMVDKVLNVLFSWLPPEIMREALENPELEEYRLERLYDPELNLRVGSSIVQLSFHSRHPRREVFAMWVVAEHPWDPPTYDLMEIHASAVQVRVWAREAIETLRRGYGFVPKPMLSKPEEPGSSPHARDE